MSKRSYFLQKDYDDLRDYAEELRKDLKEAGDAMAKSTESGETWHDNAVLDAEHEHFNNVSSRLAEVNQLLKTATVLTAPQITEYIGIGLYACIREEGVTTSQWCYITSAWMKPTEEKLDGSTKEKARRVSIGSPLSNGLVGKKVGDNASVQTPAALKQYLIEAIEK